MSKQKRNIFGELMDGVRAMKEHRDGKVTLKTHKIEPLNLSKVNAKSIRSTRKGLNMSQGIFARMLHVNRRTLANWEQGRSKPNDQAATLILLVNKFPDMLMRLNSLSI